MISQACATSVACVDVAAGRVSAAGDVQLAVATDRTSNGPQLFYPRPSAPGGAPLSTRWVLDSFAHAPWAGDGMVQAGEAVAAETGITRAELDELAALRSDQYVKALADDRVFQRRYLVPVHIPGRKHETMAEADEGVWPIVLDEIATLKPALLGGLHTFATQTHPADGCVGAILTSTERAREIANGEGVVHILDATTSSPTPCRAPACYPITEKLLL